MIRDNIKKEAKVFNEDRGFGIFKGWFQDSVDIASVEWSDKNRTVQHKRYLTECEVAVECYEKTENNRKCNEVQVMKPEDVIFQKGFLQEQLVKVDALLREKRELCKKYPSAIALRISYDSLMCHRKILVSAIEMIHSPVQFESIED